MKDIFAEHYQSIRIELTQGNRRVIVSENFDDDDPGLQTLKDLFDDALNGLGYHT